MILVWFDKEVCYIKLTKQMYLKKILTNNAFLNKELVQQESTQRWTGFFTKPDIAGITTLITNQLYQKYAVLFDKFNIFLTTQRTNNVTTGNTLWTNIIHKNKEKKLNLTYPWSYFNSTLFVKDKFLIYGQTVLGNPLKELQLSPWPILVSIFLCNGIFIIIGLFNGVSYSKSYINLSFLFVLFSIFSWLLDLGREGTFLGNHINLIRSSLYQGLGLFILSEIMFFF